MEICRDIATPTGSIYLAGSRSSPLTVAISLHPHARIVTCIDERSLGFYALGFGRATRRPAVVVTSSGTAVANLLPAVVSGRQRDAWNAAWHRKQRKKEKRKEGRKELQHGVGQKVLHFLMCSVD
jgi:hypothetical protein